MTAGYLTVSKRFVTLSRVLSSFLSSAIFIITLQCWALFFYFHYFGCFFHSYIPNDVGRSNKKHCEPLPSVGQLHTNTASAASNSECSVTHWVHAPEHPRAWQPACLASSRDKEPLSRAWKSQQLVVEICSCLALFGTIYSAVSSIMKYPSIWEPKGRDPITTKLLKQAF